VIRIEKPGAPPILRKEDMRGPKKTKLLREAYDADPAPYDAGTKTFEFDSDAYGAKSVKNALKKAQHDKCCFCEAKITHVAYGDVEHFRPKGGYRQKDSDKLGRPGYYWLAYDWSNLFLACQICNQRHKKNLFPLVDPDDRATSHHDVVDDEDPLFIHPADDEPSDFIEYNQEYARAVNGSKRGKTTVEALGLNREELVEHRRDFLYKLRELKKVRDQLTATPNLSPELQAILTSINTLLEQTVLKPAEYSSMARALLKD
jgi:uncharacterized protein (TIGR02646 family)